MPRFPIVVHAAVIASLVSICAMSMLISLTSPCLASPPAPQVSVHDLVGGKNSLSGRIEAEGLQANSEYVLCLWGVEGHDGNDILRNFGTFSYWAGGQEHHEGYYNFPTRVTSDSEGRLNESFATDELPAGKYEVRFVVKDKPDGGPVAENPGLVSFRITSRPWWETWWGILALSVAGIVSATVLGFLVRDSLKRLYMKLGEKLRQILRSGRKKIGKIRSRLP